MTSPSDFDLSIGDEIDVVRTSRRMLSTFDWFARLWAIAVVAHIVGNPRIGQAFGEPTALGWSTLVTGILATALVVRPDNRLLLRAMSIGVLVTVWFEAPFIGNHWLLAGFVSVAILVSLSIGDSWNWFSGTARGIHLAFYVFAAFAKLNSSFFDTSVSCGVVYSNQTLASWGLPTLASGSVLATLVVWTVTAIELAIPLLLVTPRLRQFGVGLGLAFHVLASFDLHQHFYDFTAVLIPLFLLWARPTLPQPLGRPLSRNADLMLAGLLGFFVVLSVMPAGRVSREILTDGVFIVWIPAALALVVFVARRIEFTTVDRPFRPPNAVSWLLVGLVVLNGLTPYTELKTGTSWNMYSNLHTAAGESNHFIVRSTVALSNGQQDPVEILETSDPGLAAYVDSGYLLPERTFLDYLADTADVEALIEQDGEVLRVDSTDGSDLHPLLERFALLRAIDTERPVRCQTVWLPAR